MTSLNKINPVQKEILANFMSRHQDLAKNNLTCPQGKTIAIKLWNDLSEQLNSNGPPVKDSKSWRKTFADQKYQIKKKMSYNKTSKKKTGGGLFDEKYLSELDVEISSACGLGVAVDGVAVKTFGVPKNSHLVIPSTTATTSSKALESSYNQSRSTTSASTSYAGSSCYPNWPSPTSNNSSIQIKDEDLQDDSPHNSDASRPPTKKRNKKSIDAKLNLIINKMKEERSFYATVCQNLDKHLELEERKVHIQERILEMEEQKHKIFMNLNT